MKIKSLLFGSAAALVATTGAYAADTVVAPEPESVEYVRVCDAYGAGYFYIPGTETCLRVSGYVRYDAAGGDNVYGRGFVDRDGGVDTRRNSWDNKARFTLRLSTASETDLGTLKTFAETRYDWGNGVEGASVRCVLPISSLAVSASVSMNRPSLPSRAISAMSSTMT